MYCRTCPLEKCNPSFCVLPCSIDLQCSILWRWISNWNDQRGSERPLHQRCNVSNSKNPPHHWRFKSVHNLVLRIETESGQPFLNKHVQPWPCRVLYNDNELVIKLIKATLNDPSAPFGYKALFINIVSPSSSSNLPHKSNKTKLPLNTSNPIIVMFKYIKTPSSQSKSSKP